MSDVFWKGFQEHVNEGRKRCTVNNFFVWPICCFNVKRLPQLQLKLAGLGVQRVANREPRKSEKAIVSNVVVSVAAIEKNKPTFIQSCPQLWFPDCRRIRQASFLLGQAGSDGGGGVGGPGARGDRGAAQTSVAPAERRVAQTLWPLARHTTESR